MSENPKLEPIGILEKNELDYRLIELKNAAITVQDVIKYSKGDICLEEICKTIIMKTQKEGKIALILVGNQRIDFKKLKPQFGKVRTATIEEILEVSGVKPGSICPLIIKIPIYVDKRVLNLKKINFGSGHQLYGLEINSEDLSRIIDYEVIDVAICKHIVKEI